MAEAYVDGGPASGNALMASFDGVSDQLQSEIGASATLINDLVRLHNEEAEQRFATLEEQKHTAHLSSHSGWAC